MTATATPPSPSDEQVKTAKDWIDCWMSAGGSWNDAQSLALRFADEYGRGVKDAANVIASAAAEYPQHPKGVVFDMVAAAQKAIFGLRSSPYEDSRDARIAQLEAKLAESLNGHITTMERQVDNLRDDMQRGESQAIAALDEEVSNQRHRITKLEQELAAALKDAEHWRANHDEQVRRKQRATAIKTEIIAEQNREIAALRERLRETAK